MKRELILVCVGVFVPCPAHMARADLVFDALPNGFVDASGTQAAFSQSGTGSDQEVFQPIPTQEGPYTLNMVAAGIIALHDSGGPTESDMDLSLLPYVDVIGFLGFPDDTPDFSDRVPLTPEMFTDSGFDSLSGFTVFSLSLDFAPWQIPAQQEVWIGLIFRNNDPLGGVGTVESHVTTAQTGYTSGWVRNLVSGATAFLINLPFSQYDGILAQQWGTARGELTSSVPADTESLWRTANNFMRLTFDQDIAAPGDDDLRIEVMLNDGLYGTSYSTSTNGLADFTVTVNTNGAGEPRVLEIRENGSVLDHRTWVAVRNTGDWARAENFVIRCAVQMGDVNNDNLVLSNDAGAVFPKVPIFNADDDERADVTGDGEVLSNDAGTVFPLVPSFNNFRPTGHGL